MKLVNVTLSLLLCLLVQISWANHAEINDGVLTLPAPTNLQITGIGTTWITASWDAVPGAVSYRVTAVETSSNTIVSQFFAYTTNAQIDGLAPGTNYDIYVASVDDAGLIGPNSSPENGTTIIIELVYEAPAPCYLLNEECTAAAGNIVDCYFQPIPGSDISQPIYGEVMDGEGKRIRFKIYYNYRTRHAVANQISSSSVPNPLIPGYVTPQEIIIPPVPEPNATFLYATKGSSPICKMEVEEINTFQSIRLIAKPVYETITFRTLLCGSDQQSGGRQNNTIPENVATILNNPFTDELLIQPASTASATARLYTLQGQLAARADIPSETTRYRLPTIDLQSGIYLLRLESEGTVQTLKVVKGN